MCRYALSRKRTKCTQKDTYYAKRYGRTATVNPLISWHLSTTTTHFMNAFIKKERRCAIRTQSKQSVQSARNNNNNHRNQFLVHEFGILQGQEQEHIGYIGAVLECLEHYKGNISAYKRDIPRECVLTPSTVQTYMTLLMPLVKAHSKDIPARMREDAVTKLVYSRIKAVALVKWQAMTWDELRKMSKDANAKAGKSKSKTTTPRVTAKVNKVVETAKREKLSNKEIDAAIRELRSLKK